MIKPMTTDELRSMRTLMETHKVVEEAPEWRLLATVDMLLAKLHDQGYCRCHDALQEAAREARVKAIEACARICRRRSDTAYAHGVIHSGAEASACEQAIRRAAEEGAL